MKDNYKITTSLSCVVCGGENFNYNDDKSYIKCNLCNREYLGGYDELVELNSNTINKAVEQMSKEVAKDLNAELLRAFGGNKNINIKL